MTQFVVMLDVFRAQKILDQFTLGTISHKETVARLVQDFSLEPQEIELLLNEIVTTETNG